jgi:hypothetical protein
MAEVGASGQIVTRMRRTFQLCSATVCLWIVGHVW